MLVGPDGYFKIVIDSFDGNTIQAWHVVGPDGSSSPNLAVFAGGKHIDALINKENGTVGNYFNSRAADLLVKYLPAQK